MKITQTGIIIFLSLVVLSIFAYYFIKSNNIFTGMESLATTGNYRKIGVEYPGVDFPGNDLGPGENLTFKQCKKKCVNNPACVGFTTDKPASTTENVTCWLKSKFANRRGHGQRYSHSVVDPVTGGRRISKVEKIYNKAANNKVVKNITSRALGIIPQPVKHHAAPIIRSIGNTAKSAVKTASKRRR
jgi:hypothetical protein